MKNKFTTGAIVGISSLAIAVPLLAQLSFAQGAATDTETSTPSTVTDTDTSTQVVPDQQVDASKGGHIGANGQREELLTGDNAARATAAALAAVPGGTIDRVETDTDGAVYEAHMTKSDGTRVTVLFDANFNVTNIESGPMRK